MKKNITNAKSYINPGSNEKEIEKSIADAELISQTIREKLGKNINITICSGWGEGAW